MPKKTAPAEQFGEAFFRRFYLNPKTRVVTSKEMIRRADLIAAFANHGELQVRSILDVGCGLGLMRDQLLRHFPKARYTGLEVSQYLCDKHGWIQGSAATFEAPRPFDLVVCYDVFQYLPARPAAAGLRNLARLCQGVLHFGALTREDWELYCDKRRTDRADSVKSFSAPALGTDGRLLYQEALSRRGRTNPEATVLWLADSATPFTRRALLTLPANVGGRAISWFTDAVWVGQDEFIARTGQLTFDAACGACPADTLLAGVALMRGTITATGVTLAVIPGTLDITRHAFAENGTSFVVVRNSAALERLPIAGGTSTPIATLPRAGTISGLSCRGTECLVTQYVNRPLPASGLDTWFYRVNLTTNTVTSLRLETGLWTGPVLLATGGDAVLQFSSAGARDLYLFKGLLP